MTRNEIIEAVNKAFTDVLEVPEEKLKPEAQIFQDLGLDSLDMVDLMIALQRKFGISLRNNEEIRQVRTLGDIYNFFEKLEAEKKQQGVDTDQFRDSVNGEK